MSNTPTITVNGLELPYWATVSIDRSIDAPVDSFSVTYGNHEQAPGGELNPLNFDGDEPVVISLGGVPIVTGYIDAPDVEIGGSTTVALAGNSKLVDLHACPVTPQTIRFRERSIASICEELCKPFGIEVDVEEGAEEPVSTILDHFTAEFGEDVLVAIHRVAAFRGLVVSSSPAGNLRLSISAHKRVTTELRLPGNLLTANVSRDARERYSDYYVSSGDISDIDPDDKGKGGVGHATDPGVSRFRPYHVEPNAGVVKLAQRQAQAEAERNRRVGGSMVVSVSVPGWEHADGVWEPNTLVRVNIKKGPIDINQDMLITTVGLGRDANSSTVQLELVHPSALKPEDVPLPRRRRKRKKSADPTIDQTELEAEFGDLGDYGELDDDWNDAELNPF